MLSRNYKRESSETDDVDLVHAAKLGDLAAFDTLVIRHSGLVFQIVRAILRCDHDAEDVVQDAFLSAFQNLGQFEERARFSTWLSRIAYHAALSKVHRARRMAAISIDNDTEEGAGLEEKIRDWRPNPEQLYNSVELRAILQQTIASLPERHRIVFVLRDLQEVSVSDTAAILGISISNVKVCLHRARLQLRKQLSRHFERNDSAMASAVPQRKPVIHAQPHLVTTAVSSRLDPAMSDEDGSLATLFTGAAQALSAAAGK